MVYRVSTLVLLAVSLVACGPSQATVVPSSVPSTRTPAPTETLVPATPSRVPPTATLALTETPIPAGQAILIPQGMPPTIDGTLRSGEWDEARQEPFSDGSSTVYLMHDGSYLYVGIRGQQGGAGMVANVLVDQGEVAIMHSSAALGTARYRQQGDHWQLVSDFVWRARMTSDTDMAVQERQQFFEEEGWLASIGPRGAPADVEYQIGMPEGQLRIAVIIIGPPDYEEVVWWPSSLDDDCLAFLDLFRDGAPDEIRFDLNTWALVIAE